MGKESYFQCYNRYGNDGVHFTIEDIVRNYYHSASNRVSVFEYINKQIDRLYASGKERTSETYRQVLHSFMRFRKMMIWILI